MYFYRRNIISSTPKSDVILRLETLVEMDKLLKENAMPSFTGENENGGQLRVYLSEDDTIYNIRAEIPGVDKNDIKVQIMGNRVSISAKTKYRSFCLDGEVDDTKAQAKYENDMLELTLPKINNRIRNIVIK